jgi:CBS domain-containing protein
MTTIKREVRTVDPMSAVSEAMMTMSGSGVSRGPVLDHERNLVGIVSRRDRVLTCARRNEGVSE